jgi:hypothetical protein
LDVPFQRDQFRIATQEIESFLGSAREFGETANWRRLERFSLPGISEVRIQALSGRSEASNLLSSAVSEDLESWNTGLYVSDGGRNPLFYGAFGAVLPSRMAWLAQSQHPIELAR